MFKNILSLLESRLMREKIKIGHGWHFRREEETQWREVGIPHDWAIEGPFSRDHFHDMEFIGEHVEFCADSCLPKGTGQYKINLNIEKKTSDEVIYLEFEGVFSHSEVFVNGKLAGKSNYGYTGSIYDITPFVKFDSDNLIEVKVDANPMEGWWYEGAGIYRDVYLIRSNKTHISPWGVFIITPEVSPESAKVKIQTSIKNLVSCDIKTVIKNSGGDIVCEDIVPACQKTIEQILKIDNPILWSVDFPKLYMAELSLLVDGEVVDSVVETFGIRTFEFTADRQFVLNGKSIQLRGVNIHHDFGGLGAALPRRAHYKNVEVLKEMGVNVIRSAHNAAAPALMQACDELGVLFWAEHRYLPHDVPEKTRQPLENLILRDRNHPSIITWCLANTAGDKEGILTGYLKKLNAIVKELDITRPTSVGLEANADADENGFAQVTDVVGYNGGGMWGRDLVAHELFPDRPIVITEFSSGRGSRSVYETNIIGEPFYRVLGDGRKVLNCGQYCNMYEHLQRLESEWTHIATTPWLIGGLIWAGIDYRGETTGWPIVTSQFGPLDYCRFPKDAFYYLQQEWTEKPMIHLLPHWNWEGKEGQEIDVWCYSNCQEAELFFNGQSLGRKPTVSHSHIEWKVPYAPGSIKAVAYRDEEVVIHEIKTAGAPVALEVKVDCDSIPPDDVAFLTVSAVDAEGNFVPIANNRINIEVKGQGKLIGLCNGDPGCHELPGQDNMPLYNGLLLAIIKSFLEVKEEPIEIILSTEGMPVVSVKIRIES